VSQGAKGVVPLPDSSGGFDQVMRAAQRHRYQAANTYDFRQTEKFTTDQNRFLEKLFVGFAEAVVTQLAPLLQARFTMDLISVKPKSYSGYIGNIPDPTPIIVFKVDSETSSIIDLDFDLAFAMFEKLMGGKGMPPRDDVRGYLTELERSILRRPFNRILTAFGQAWRDFKVVEPVWTALEFNPNAVHICTPSETMVVTTFQVEVAMAKGMLNLVVPFRYLKASIPRTSYDEFVLTKTGTNLGQAGASVTPVFATKIGTAKVPVSVSLGRAELMFQELLGIEVGDTIKLDQEIREPLRVKVNGRTKFLGHPGIKDGKIATRVSRVLQEGDEEYDE
jgi:flagellar motor switch protein FliM